MTAQTRNQARKQRVLELCDLGELLQSYGYAITPDRQHEQQFSCDLHGSDVKPSARYYGPTNSTYCWVCQKSRDAISYVMEKEQIGFLAAIKHLEDKLGLEPLPWEGNEELDSLENTTPSKNISFEDEEKRLKRLLQQLTDERFDSEALDCGTLLAFWEGLDIARFHVAKKIWDEEKGIRLLTKLRAKVFERIKHA